MKRSGGAAEGPPVGRSFAFVLLILALTLLASPLSAQLEGRVVDPAGAPLKDAVVDLWTPTVRLAQAITGLDGGFAFRTQSGGVRLVVRRIGARAVVKILSSADSVVRIVLAPAPVGVEELRVEGGRCSSRDESEARRSWRAAAAKYRFPAESLWLASEMKVVQERVPVDHLGRPVADSTGFGWTAGHVFGQMQRWWELRIGRSGFVAVDPESQGMEAEVVSVHHQYWVSPAFGESVRLTMVDPTTIRFCPKRRERPWVEGEIGLAEDQSILWVRWRYGSGRPQPATGATALFLAPAIAGALPLLPSSETIWQERPSGMAAQRTREYREWKLTVEEPKWGGPVNP